MNPEVGKKYITRRKGKVRKVLVLSENKGGRYRSSTSAYWAKAYGPNTHWLCRDLRTGKEVEMKSKANFLRELEGE